MASKVAAKRGRSPTSLDTVDGRRAHCLDQREHIRKRHCQGVGVRKRSVATSVEYENSGWTSVKHSSGPITVNDASIKQLRNYSNRKTTQAGEEEYQPSPMEKQRTVLDRLLESGKEGTKFRYTPEENKKIVQWMVINNAVRSKGHEEEFDALLADLRFYGNSLSDAQKMDLRRRTTKKLLGLDRDSLRSVSAIKSCTRGVKMGEFTVEYEPWTRGWLEEDWDGQLKMPISYSVERYRELLPEDIPERLIVQEGYEPFDTM